MGGLGVGVGGGPGGRAAALARWRGRRALAVAGGTLAIVLLVGLAGRTAGGARDAASGAAAGIARRVTSTRVPLVVMQSTWYTPGKAVITRGCCHSATQRHRLPIISSCPFAHPDPELPAMKGLAALLLSISWPCCAGASMVPCWPSGARNGGQLARPFICVGVAYFLIAVLAPMIMLRVRGESRALEHHRHHLEPGGRIGRRDRGLGRHPGVGVSRQPSVRDAAGVRRSSGGQHVSDNVLGQVVQADQSDVHRRADPGDRRAPVDRAVISTARPRPPRRDRAAARPNDRERTAAAAKSRRQGRAARRIAGRAVRVGIRWSFCSRS